MQYSGRLSRPTAIPPWGKGEREKIMSDKQDAVRRVLFWATSGISNESVAGYVFGVALVITDHVFNVADLLRPVTS